MHSTIHKPMYLHILSLDLLKSTRDLEMDNQLGHRNDYEKATGVYQRRQILKLINDSCARMKNYDDLIIDKIKNPS